MKMVFTLKHSWGVASLRLCSGYPTSEYHYMAPLCSSLVDWDIISKRCKKYKAHNDLITVFCKNVQGVSLSISFHGEVKLWNSTLSEISNFNIPSYYVIYGSWSNDGIYFGICTKGPKQMLLLYDLNSIFSEKDTPRWTYKAPQEDESKTESFDCFNACIFKKNANILAIYQSEKTCKIFELSIDGELIKKVEVSPLNDDVNIMLCISTIQNNLFAVGLQNGIFAFYDADTLEFNHVIQASGSPQICLWQNDLFITTSYSNGIMTVWDGHGKQLHEIDGMPTGSIVHMDVSLSKNNSSYWIGGIMSLNYITLTDDKKNILKKDVISFLKLTGCGISVSENNIVASGDFTGNIMLWDTLHDQPIKTNQIETSVRCLEWFKDVVLVGSLDGVIYAWYTDNESGVEEIFQFIGGVTIAKLSHDKKYLAVGTTGGYLYVFNIDIKSSKLSLSMKYHKLQHNPKKSPDGSMIPMEIWSLCWSPDNEYIVTTSEDQTSAISKAADGNVFKSLSGHTTAVTSVDWKVISNEKCYLITCADDKTARIYDGRTFTYLKSVNTYDVYGWHTLTYMCINAAKDLLICATQNGYLVAWDLKSFACVYKKKQHGGSIEGLVLDDNDTHVYTVGSDCVVNSFEFD